MFLYLIIVKFIVKLFGDDSDNVKITTKITISNTYIT